MKKQKDKFKFGIDFQQLIIQYIVTDTTGFKVLELLQDGYFDVLYHQTIVYALKKYYKKNKRIPEEPYFREFLRTIYEQERILDVSFSSDDKEQISEIIKTIYTEPVSQPEEIVKKCVDFARYVKFKSELDEVDIDNFDSYEQAINKLVAANRIGIDITHDYGTFLVEGMKDRAYKRNMAHLVNPTPWSQLNRLLNSGGTPRGSVFCFMGKEKRFKTGMMINTCRGYLRMRKKGFYADLENGESAITTRSEQSMTNQNQETITSEVYDEKLLKLMRKYKRLGAELVVKRFPALTTTCADISKWLHDLKREFGFTPDFGVIDYGVLLASISGKTDEFGRISDSFLDMKNLSLEHNLEAIYTAAHITRDGDKRTKTKYVSTDIAKCIDIPRHCDAVLGLQENEDEVDAGVMRIEVIEQRNGMRSGNCLMWVNMETQVAREFTKAEIKEYRSQVGETMEGNKPKREKKAKTTDL